MNQVDDLNLLAEISSMYYHDEAKQSDIAKKYNISRSLVSKYLDKAKKLGIIEFVIHDKSLHLEQKYHDLENIFKDFFSLSNVIIVEAHNVERIQKERVAAVASNYLLQQLDNQSIITLAGGTTINQVVESLQTNKQYPEVSVVSMAGGLGKDFNNIQTNIIADRLANKLNSEVINLYAPAVVDTIQAKEILIEQSFIKEALDIAKKADIALVGIGGNPIQSSITQAFEYYEHVNNETLPLDIVGDISYNFINNYGQLVNCNWNKRMIGLGLNDIKNIPQVIGVAEGTHKAESIYATLFSSLIDVLITDSKTANKILQLAYSN